MRIRDPQAEDLMTLVTRYFAGYQETILGNEGMIISKRLAVPLGSHYDRAALWMLECQAEGDRLLRLDIEIDWGEPLTQRIVDGLLVAQSNPRRAQGIYRQRNADRTCVFGNPQGRPSAYEFDDQGRALLTYYVLVNGIVEVPIVLTASDVGEQVAWSGFLALRDAEREFESSSKKWDQILKTGRLWTPDPQLNRAIQAGRLSCVRNLQRMRTGIAPTSRRIEDAPAFVNCLDAFDVTMSRNLLAHLRRLAEKSEGRIPTEFPVHPKDPVLDPEDDIVDTISAYLEALHGHLGRHPDAELLKKHLPAITLCADNLVRMRWEEAGDETGVATEVDAAAAVRGLAYAAELAAAAGDGANAARWESEAALRGQGLATTDRAQTFDWMQWVGESGWQSPDDEPWGFSEPGGGIRLAGEAVWHVCGLQWHDDRPWVYPIHEPELRWWALTDMPLADKSVTLVWDGSTLHSTYPVCSDRPVAIHEKIRVLNTEEHNFDLRFDMVDLSVDLNVDLNDSATEGERIVNSFRPRFDRGVDE
jgi:hypothetical protein